MAIVPPAVMVRTPGVDRVEDGLDVVLPGLELGRLLVHGPAAVLDVGDHLVEGVDEEADLVGGRVLDLDREVALRDVLGRLGELLDGDGDALGDVEADPDRGEDDQHGHEDQEQEEHRLGQVLGLPRPEAVDERRQGGSLLGVVLGQELAGDDQGVADRGIGVETPVRTNSPAPMLRFSLIGSPRWARLDGVGLQLLVILKGQIRVVIGKQLFLLDEDPDFVEPVFGQLGPEEVLEPAPILRGEQVLAADFLAELGGIVLGHLGGRGVEAVGHLLGVVQDPGEVRLEPLLDVAVDQVAREQEEEQRGDEGQGHEEADELDLEMRADDLPLALEIKLGQVAAEDEEENQGHEEDDDLEHVEQNVGDVGRREFRRPAEEEIDHEEEDDEEDDDPPDDAGASFFPVLHGHPPQAPSFFAEASSGTSSRSLKVSRLIRTSVRTAPDAPRGRSARPLRERVKPPAFPVWRTNSFFRRAGRLLAGFPDSVQRTAPSAATWIQVSAANFSSSLRSWALAGSSGSATGSWRAVGSGVSEERGGGRPRDHGPVVSPRFEDEDKGGNGDGGDENREYYGRPAPSGAAGLPLLALFPLLSGRGFGALDVPAPSFVFLVVLTPQELFFMIFI